MSWSRNSQFWGSVDDSDDDGGQWCFVPVVRSVPLGAIGECPCPFCGGYWFFMWFGLAKFFYDVVFPLVEGKCPIDVWEFGQDVIFKSSNGIFSWFGGGVGSGAPGSDESSWQPVVVHGCQLGGPLELLFPYYII